MSGEGCFLGSWKTHMGRGKGIQGNTKADTNVMEYVPLQAGPESCLSSSGTLEWVVCQMVEHVKAAWTVPLVLWKGVCPLYSWDPHVLSSKSCKWVTKMLLPFCSHQVTFFLFFWGKVWGLFFFFKSKIESFQTYLFDLLVILLVWKTHNWVVFPVYMLSVDSFWIQKQVCQSGG